MKMLKGTTMALAVALLGAASQLQAQVTFTVKTTGCFYTGASCSPSSAGPNFSTQNGLSFQGSTWTENTTGGAISVDGAVVNFGEFSVSGTQDYAALGQMFDLYLTFYNPLSVAGDGLFTAKVTGSVSSTSSGAIIKYSPLGAIVRSYTHSEGSFDVTVQNVPIHITGDNFGQGYIEVTATPEPATLMLLGTGLLALVPVARRRRRNNVA
jgi:hypothetical protein